MLIDEAVLLHNRTESGLRLSLIHICGMTDEDKIGFTYATLDHYVLTGECEDEEIKKKIDRMHAINLHKLQLMPTFKLEEHE